MIPDTFFFVKVEINKQEHVFGPYLDLQHATIILVDVLPQILTLYTKNNRYSYQAKITENIMDPKDTWKEISTPIVENYCYRYITEETNGNTK
jgi:hypothetical protein